MTAVELTTEMNSLTDVELRRVQIFIANLKRNRGVHPATKKMTRSEMVRDIKKSHAQANRGKTTSAFRSLENIRKQYGLQG